MTKIKLCGIRRKEDIELVNLVKPDYIGYVFAKSSKRYVTPEAALELTRRLDPEIIPVGVFVDEAIENVISLYESGAIKAAQLHGEESGEYISELQKRGITVIKAFKVKNVSDAEKAEQSHADIVLLDSGSGSGEVFDWSLIETVRRDYFLAGGLNEKNVSDAIKTLHPFAVDASSCIETNGFKDLEKAQRFVAAIR